MNYQSKVFDSEHKIRRLIKLANTNAFSAPRLAKFFNCNKKTIFRILKENKITLPNLGRFKKKIYVNDNFFTKLNSVSAYWAGFIAADGVLSNRDKNLSIALNKRDVKHLYKFIKAVKSNAHVGCIKSNNSAHVNLYSKPLYNSLLKLGITPNKSLTIKYVKIPLSLMPHFIRGTFDGDGWISGKKVTHIQFGIAGNRPFLQQIQDILIKRCHINRVKLYPLSQGGKAYKLQYTGSQIFRILNFLYKKSSYQIRLDRKYQKMLELKRKFGINDVFSNMN